MRGSYGNYFGSAHPLYVGFDHTVIRLERDCTRIMIQHQVQHDAL